MEKTIYVVGIAAALLLLCFTTVIVWLNWSEKTLNPLMSVLLVGTASVLVAVGFPLKATIVESAFATPVVWDMKNGFPPMPMPGPNSKPTTEQSALATLGTASVIMNGQETKLRADARDANTVFPLGAQLLQYRLVKLLDEVQRDKTGFGFSFGYSVSEISQSVAAADSVIYPPDQIAQQVASNTFSQLDAMLGAWRMSKMRLPKGARLSLVSEKGAQVVRIEKPLFFRIDFSVQPIGATSVGLLPAAIIFPDEVRNECQTFHYKIQMRADFKRITAGNTHTEEYKDWASRLFVRIKSEMGA